MPADLETRIAEARKALALAERALRDEEARVRGLAQAAYENVKEDLAPNLNALRDARTAANAALLEAMNATPDHPWGGQRVFKVERRHVSPWSSKQEAIRTEGQVETFRSGSTVPGNKTYGLPEIGTPIVRFLKKDGKPGAKFERLNDYKGQPMWQLAGAASDAR